MRVKDRNFKGTCKRKMGPLGSRQMPRKIKKEKRIPFIESGALIFDLKARKISKCQRIPNSLSGLT
jgi:hypothetical protein